MQNQIDQLRKILGLTDGTNSYKVIRKQLVQFKKSVLTVLIQNQKIIQVTIVDTKQKKVYDKVLIELMNMDVKMNINFQSHEQKVLFITLLLQVRYIEYRYKQQFINSEQEKFYFESLKIVKQIEQSTGLISLTELEKAEYIKLLMRLIDIQQYHGISISSSEDITIYQEQTKRISEYEKNLLALTVQEKSEYERLKIFIIQKKIALQINYTYVNYKWTQAIIKNLSDMPSYGFIYIQDEDEKERHKQMQDEIRNIMNKYEVKFQSVFEKQLYLKKVYEINNVNFKVSKKEMKNKELQLEYLKVSTEIQKMEKQNGISKMSQYEKYNLISLLLELNRLEESFGLGFQDEQFYNQYMSKVRQLKQ